VLELWYDIVLQPGPRPALVLDASAASRQLWPYLRSLTEGVLEAMPPSSQPRLFFLGNPQPYAPRDFRARAEDWCAGNAGRARIIGLIFERLAEEPGTTVAVVGGGRIFDLADWRGHPLARNAIWCKVGQGSMTGGAYAEENYACEQLAERLNNPAVGVEIDGAGVMPFFWDDPTFRWQDDRLVGSRTEGTVRLGVLAADETRLRAFVVQASGARWDLAPKPATPPPARDWVKIPTGEFNLLRQCLRQGHFHCPLCDRGHPAGTYTCPQSKTRPVFPVLEKLSPGNLGLLNTGSWDAKVRPSPCPALLLNAETVAMRLADGVALYRYEAASDLWKPGEQFAFSHELEKDLHALVL
jgi:hypothetical protein